jgi:predicted nucleic acid-binding protein
VASVERATRGARATRRVSEAPPHTFYVESSGLLAAILEKDEAANRSIRSRARVVASALTLTEANRAIVRGRVSGKLTPEREREVLDTLQTFQKRCTVLMISEQVLVRAGHPFPSEPVRTLDAIHLATLQQLGGPPQLVTIVTREARIRKNAIALGYNVE